MDRGPLAGNCIIFKCRWSARRARLLVPTPRTPLPLPAGEGVLGPLDALFPVVLLNTPMTINAARKPRPEPNVPCPEGARSSTRIPKPQPRTSAPRRAQVANAVAAILLPRATARYAVTSRARAALAANNA